MFIFPPLAVLLVFRGVLYCGWNCDMDLHSTLPQDGAGSLSLSRGGLKRAARIWKRILLCTRWMARDSGHGFLFFLGDLFDITFHRWWFLAPGFKPRALPWPFSCRLFWMNLFWLPRPGNTDLVNLFAWTSSFSNVWLLMDLRQSLPSLVQRATTKSRQTSIYPGCFVLGGFVWAGAKIYDSLPSTWRPKLSNHFIRVRTVLHP